MELLVVLAIIGVLATLTFSNFLVAPVRARDVQRKHDLQQLRTALQLYYTDNTYYPTTACNSTESCWSTLLDASYMKKMPTDPKNTSPYIYYYVPDCTGTYDYFLRARLENQDNKDPGVKQPNGTVTTKCATPYTSSFTEYVLIAP